MLPTFRVLLESPFRQPRLYPGQDFVFDSFLAPHASYLFPTTSRLSGKTPRLSDNHAILPESVSSPSLRSGEGFREGMVLRKFPSSTTTTPAVAENSRNIRQKLPFFASFLRTYFPSMAAIRPYRPYFRTQLTVYMSTRNPLSDTPFAPPFSVYGWQGDSNGARG